MPYQTKTGWTYDTGNYAIGLAKCQALADWSGYEARRAKSEAAGRRSREACHAARGQRHGPRRPSCVAPGMPPEARTRATHGA